VVLQNKKINLLGDSITEGACVTSAKKIYHQILKEESGLAEARNYGMGGTRIARQKHISDIVVDNNDFNIRCENMNVDADIIIVFGGTNDYGHGDAPLGKFSDRTEYTFYGACHLLFEKLIEKYNKSKIIIVTPMHRDGDNILNFDGYTLKNYVNALIEVALYYNLSILNLFEDKELNPNIANNNEKYFADGLHPNDEGHAVLAGIFKNFLLKL